MKESDLFLPLDAASGGRLVLKEEGEGSLGSTVASRLALSESYQVHFEAKLNRPYLGLVDF